MNKKDEYLVIGLVFVVAALVLLINTLIEDNWVYLIPGGTMLILGGANAIKSVMTSE